MRINPYLRFDGQCAEAFAFYERALGGTMETLLRNGESPVAAEMPPETHHRVMHASLRVAGVSLMGSDGPPDACSPTTRNAAVMVGVDTPEEAERVFAALSEGGTAQMPMRPTFWSKRFGMVTDRFGTPWIVNCEQAPG